MKEEQKLLSAPGNGVPKDENKILEAAREIINSKLPEADLAPHGRNPDGSPIAPYGFRVNGLPKKLPGRPFEKERNRDKPKDERDLLNEIEEEINLNEYKDEPAPEVTSGGEQIPPKDPEPQPAPAFKPTTGKHKVYISGAMFLFALDLLLPKTISFVYGTFLGLEFTNPKELKLDEDDKKDLAPLCDDVVEELLNTLSPLQQFMLYTGILYATKVSDAETRPKAKKEKKPKVAK